MKIALTRAAVTSIFAASVVMAPWSAKAQSASRLEFTVPQELSDTDRQKIESNINSKIGIGIHIELKSGAPASGAAKSLEVTKFQSQAPDQVSKNFLCDAACDAGAAAAAAGCSALSGGVAVAACLAATSAARDECHRRC